MICSKVNFDYRTVTFRNPKRTLYFLECCRNSVSRLSANRHERHSNKQSVGCCRTLQNLKPYISIYHLPLVPYSLLTLDDEATRLWTREIILEFGVRSMSRSKLMAAVRRKCLFDCAESSPKEVALCPCKNCPLYPYRLGVKPESKVFRAKLDRALEKWPEEAREVGLERPFLETPMNKTGHHS